MSLQKRAMRRENRTARNPTEILPLLGDAQDRRVGEECFHLDKRFKIALIDITITI
jgi:hypothetical protein